ncbi:MAG: YkgJ family cysteine cluster protein [Desulfamplus sp.]|nr:YkgJ family cysteine cluster protein [Desulfamplus sp.]
MDSELKRSDDIFQCVMCGDCCAGFGGTYVTQKDIEKISAFINCDSIKFKEKFCSSSGSKYVLAQSETGQCIFFQHDRQCSIHPVKPHMCKAWPFIPTLVSNPENWDAMADSCSGMKKNIPYDVIIRIVSSEISNLAERESIPWF